MFAAVLSGGVRGITSYLMQVEVDAADGLPSFVMVGYASGDTREAGDRVRVALKNAGYHIPPMRITVNLSPAAIRKERVSVDLPLAMGLLCATGELPEECLADTLVFGELGLDGEVRSVRGTLPIVARAAQAGIRTCILPADNAREGAAVSGMKIVGVRTLEEAVLYLKASAEERDGLIPPTTVDLEEVFAAGETSDPADFSDINGQETVKRAAMIAAAGFHHLLLIGPPGTGKSMIAKRMPGILPPLSEDESIEVSTIYSVAGLMGPEDTLITRRPFISPHHTVTEAALTGGGASPRPGLISLAHRGVLFLDELPEFHRATLDLLRQPMEDRRISIARAGFNCVYPADFMLIAAMNPCPCGYYPDRNRCRCAEHEIRRYLGRISGPILDRIDICVEAPRVKIEDLSGTHPAGDLTSAAIRDRVLAARGIQKKRFTGTKLRFNADMEPADIKRYCALGDAENAMLSGLFRSMGLSARAYHRILRLARTIADLDGSERICKKHIAEAACYRRADSSYWSGGGAA
ncbi:MAG: YifB family Mg chelatase-like AAA ATPase [Lachnospiraceae bacterium]|nr:YifB family Mg chelatase-like AAA ATPase [Lachnospiraceae bacterium]